MISYSEIIKIVPRRKLSFRGLAVVVAHHAGSVALTAPWFFERVLPFLKSSVEPSGTTGSRV